MFAMHRMVTLTSVIRRIFSLGLHILCVTEKLRFLFTVCVFFSKFLVVVQMTFDSE